MQNLNSQETDQLFQLLHKYVDKNEERTFTLALETIRQRIGRPIAHVRDREILQYLQQWKSKQDTMSIDYEPEDNGQL